MAGKLIEGPVDCDRYSYAVTVGDIWIQLDALNEEQ